MGSSVDECPEGKTIKLVLEYRAYPCPECGHLNPGAALNCANCGWVLKF